MNIKILHIIIMISISCCSLSCMNYGSVNYSTQSSIEKIKSIAEQYAQEKNYDLSEYKPPVINFDPEDKTWTVSYMLKCQGFFFFKKCMLGGEFAIVIDDLTGDIVYFFQGA